eukprot:TRINITY_DN19899_c0_g1_i1.p1 TRINITY_DN19899_c0_g1~~TRINITY_DN19899_c0_g1_i1.p1  ORF type:complete len:114 (-),score=27.33 TRINITY_DN19899_c0_g1_i1:48-389(-)
MPKKKAAPVGDATKGEKLFKARCTQCHTINKGGPNKQGPNLYGIVGRKTGSVPGYSYTKANREADITWTPENLFEYLEKPKKFIPKTKMTFAGFRKPQDRADVVAYLERECQD